jgi:hypothetical protein
MKAMSGQIPSSGFCNRILSGADEAIPMLLAVLDTPKYLIRVWQERVRWATASAYLSAAGIRKMGIDMVGL